LRYPEGMIPKKLEQIAETDFEGLVANSVPEGKTIDYKSSGISLRGISRKRPLLAEGENLNNPV
jgi:hypothetical protein